MEPRAAFPPNWNKWRHEEAPKQLLSEKRRVGGDKRLNHMYNCSEVVAVSPEDEKHGSCSSFSALVRSTVLQPELTQTILDDLFTNSRGKL